MNMRKLLALLLAAVMVFGMFAGCSNKEENTSTAPTASTDNTTSAAPTSTPKVEITWENKIVMGTTTDPQGDLPGYWSNGATDSTANSLTRGYATVEQTYQGAEYVNNPTAVKNVTYTTNADGSKTGTWTLNNDLVWSDGSPITAKDYVRHVMLFSSPAIIADGAGGSSGRYFTGWSEFSKGETPIFEGVNLVDEYTFSLTMAAEWLPNFFESAYFAMDPENVNWLPSNYDIADDGNGAYFTKDGAQITLDESELENIKPAIDNWRWNPTAFSGQYYLDNYDAAGLAYTLKINPLYKGNWEGKKASIETLVLKKVQQETMMDELRTGAVDFIEKTTDGSETTAGLNMYEEGIVNYTKYDRNGYGFFGFKCTVGPAQFQEVRHAVAHLLDRNDFATTFTAGFGNVVHGPYGNGMWMTQQSAEELNERLNTYNYNVDEAIRLLEEGGWTLNADGTPYSGSGLRYKAVTAEQAGTGDRQYPECVTLADGTILMPCRIQWCSSEGNSVSDLLVTKLAQGQGTATAGIEIKQTTMTFAELLEHYSDAKEPYYCAFNLATNFSAVYDQVAATDPDSNSNSFGIRDPKMHELAEDMLRVEPGDNETFLELWVDFIDEWNDYLPALPLYSNEYYDFFTPHLTYKVYSDFIGFDGSIIYGTVEGYEDFNQ